MADHDPLDAYELHFEEERSEPHKLERWRRTTASGAIAGAVALGLQQVFDPEKKTTIAIEQEAPEDPPEPGHLELSFDPMDSRATSVVVHLPPEPE